jgi:acetyl esterase/lipase
VRESPPTRKGRRCALGAAALLVLGCSPAFSPYRLHKNVVYDPSIGGAGYFDLYVPPGRVDRKYPALVVIHGGAFESDDKRWARSFAGDIATRGFVVMAIDYREAPANHWPAQLEDCRSAVRYLRRNAANLGVDPDRIAALGVSCGACLASLLALEDDPDADPEHAHLSVFVDVAGESDFSCGDAFPNQARILTDLFGAGPPFPQQLLDDISPIKHVRPDVTALVIHGVSDPMMNVDQSDRFCPALQAAGANVTYIRRNSSQHSDTLDTGHLTEAVCDFLEHTLR